VTVTNSPKGIRIQAAADGSQTAWTLGASGAFELVADTAATRRFRNWSLTVDDALSLISALAGACAEAQSA